MGMDVWWLSGRLRQRERTFSEQVGVAALSMSFLRLVSCSYQSRRGFMASVL